MENTPRIRAKPQYRKIITIYTNILAINEYKKYLQKRVRDHDIYGNKNKSGNKDRIIKIFMNNKGIGSPSNIPWNIRYYEVSMTNLSMQARLSESDLVSDKMK